MASLIVVIAIEFLVIFGLGRLPSVYTWGQDHKAWYFLGLFVLFILINVVVAMLW